MSRFVRTVWHRVRRTMRYAGRRYIEMMATCDLSGSATWAGRSDV